MGNRAARGQQQPGLQGYGQPYDPNYGMDYYGGAYDPPGYPCKFLLSFCNLYMIHTCIHTIFF